MECKATLEPNKCKGESTVCECDNKTSLTMGPKASMPLQAGGINPDKVRYLAPNGSLIPMTALPWHRDVKEKQNVKK